VSKKKKKHHKKRNRHHIKPKSRGGSKATCNMLLINIEKHRIWHKLFGLRTIDEVISLLKRVKRAKHTQKWRT